jgi:predicted regulator of Ras-like GTPase activity (Roadblock/LC7/MglB family)
MTIPFKELFKKAKARLGKQSPPARVERPRVPVQEKPTAERLSKTVMPNATRTVAAVDPFKVAAGSMARFRETSPSPTTQTGERSISLSLVDILDQLPQDSIKPRDSFDVNRCISIKAADVEKGMSTGQPTASLVSIYEQAPEIFLQSITSGDLTQVPLPFAKVMEQFQTLHVRDDQMQDEAIPQVETPFLQVTIEDTQRFGTSIAPLQTSAKPPVKVEPATARSLSKAEPEAVAQQKTRSDTASRRPTSKNRPAPTMPAAEPSAGPTRIPFKLPPNGAGAPASERVPASSGPPVPTPPPAPPRTSAPVRIPFKMTPPGPELKPKLTLVPGVDPAKSEPETAVDRPAQEKGATIRLRLNVCLRNLPAFQLSGALPEIADDVMIELPYPVIEPQLASGRVAIDPKLFHQAIPENFRHVFVVDTTETPVLLPLQEVLQHIPSAALKMRHDQEQEEAVNYFDTPFSKQAQEDQKRFQGTELATASPSIGEQGAGSTEQPKSTENPVSKPGEAEKPATVEVENKAAEQLSTSPDAPSETKPLPAEGSEKAPSIEATSNAKEFVLKASCLPGVTACSISFADGLTMAGNFPPGLGADGICAMAPSLLQKIEKHMPESDLGELTAMTLHCAKSPLTFFMEGNVCLTVLHSERQLEQVTHEQLVEMTKELAQIFAQPETTHVDH